MALRLDDIKCVVKIYKITNLPSAAEPMIWASCAVHFIVECSWVEVI